MAPRRNDLTLGLATEPPTQPPPWGWRSPICAWWAGALLPWCARVSGRHDFTGWPSSRKARERPGRNRPSLPVTRAGAPVRAFTV
jgi:hypothetical protein